MKKLFNITDKQFQEIQKLSLDLNHVFLMEQYTDPDRKIRDISPKEEVMYRTLIRKGYMTEYKTLTVAGSELLEILKTDNPEVKEVLEKKIEQKLQGFDLFWSEFPAHNGWGKFEKTRALRRNMANCKKIFEDTVKEGKYTAEQITQGMKNHVAILKKTSKLGDNKLSFLQNSETYLRQRSYEVFIGEEKQAVAKSNKVVDI